MNKNKIFYLLKPLIRREVQIALRELISSKILERRLAIDQKQENPFGWG
jgi:hypothetical protein